MSSPKYYLAGYYSSVDIIPPWCRARRGCFSGAVCLLSGQMGSQWCHFLLANMRVQLASRPRSPVNTTLNWSGYSELTWEDKAGLRKFPEVRLVI